MPITDEEVMKADAKSRPEVYAVTTMYMAMGALATISTENCTVGNIIRQLEVAIDKLRNSTK
jgi:hypothetical protein